VCTVVAVDFESIRIKTCLFAGLAVTELKRKLLPFLSFEISNFDLPNVLFCRPVYCFELIVCLFI